MPPLVSAIIPTYNRAELLARALASVAEQTHRPIEAVVIDDGSTDDTPAMLEQQRPAMEKAGVDLVTRRQANGKAPRARNFAMSIARGELFAFLDNDDLWKPEYLRTMAGLLEVNPSADLAFCAIAVIDPEDRFVKDRATGLAPEPRQGVLHRPFETILKHMPTQTSGVVVRRGLIAQLGDFDLDLPVVEDWDLWYRASKVTDFAFTQEALACNREHPNNLPKFGEEALSSSIRMNLKHLPDVKDPAVRRLLEERIARQTLLLREELLRVGRRANGLAPLLTHRLAPRSMRFRMGGVFARGPRWAGKAYAGAIRAMGRKKRGQ